MKVLTEGFVHALLKINKNLHHSWNISILKKVILVEKGSLDD